MATWTYFLEIQISSFVRETGKLENDPYFPFKSGFPVIKTPKYRTISLLISGFPAFFTSWHWSKFPLISGFPVILWAHVKPICPLFLYFGGDSVSVRSHKPPWQLDFQEICPGNHTWGLRNIWIVIFFAQIIFPKKQKTRNPIFFSENWKTGKRPLFPL